MAWKHWHVETESKNPADTAKGGQMISGNFETETAVKKYVEDGYPNRKVTKVIEFVDGLPVEAEKKK